MGGFTLGFVVIQVLQVLLLRLAMAGTSSTMALIVGINWGVLFLISFRQSWASFISALLPSVSVLPPAYLVNLDGWPASPALPSPTGPSHLPSILFILSRLLSGGSSSRGRPAVSPAAQDSAAITSPCPLPCLRPILHVWTQHEGSPQAMPQKYSSATSGHLSHLGHLCPCHYYIHHTRTRHQPYLSVRITLHSGGEADCRQWGKPKSCLKLAWKITICSPISDIEGLHSYLLILYRPGTLNLKTMLRWVIGLAVRWTVHHCLLYVLWHWNGLTFTQQNCGPFYSYGYAVVLLQCMRP